MSLGSLESDTRPVALRMKELHKREVSARSKYYRKVATMVEYFVEHESDPKMEKMIVVYENMRLEFMHEMSSIESTKKDLRRRRKEERHSSSHANHDDHA
jgi:hypothetical protein